MNRSFVLIWCHRGDESEPPALLCLLYMTQKEESLVQLHNSINDCICNIPKDLFSYLVKHS